MKKTREIVLELICKQPDITTARLAELTGLTTKGIQWQIAQLETLQQFQGLKAGVFFKRS